MVFENICAAALVMRKAVGGSLAVAAIGGGVMSVYTPANAATRHPLVTQSPHDDKGYTDDQLGRITGLGAGFFDGNGPIRVDHDGWIHPLSPAEQKSGGSAAEPGRRKETSTAETQPSTRTLPAVTRPGGNTGRTGAAGNTADPNNSGTRVTHADDAIRTRPAPQRHRSEPAQ